ncbi:phosphoribosylaminoimidazolesuccinocarboxamide synthase [Carnobacterium gallinarum]|uniref:phosphoribosylaminoimidazolesuccinocarboxamide synthase n=1 Tax=Carnobacterium gallinarum TaxID=2749 RepID=UPI000559162C|nr:phosphoribosylaminoimidazolesuccinocarboxamide synthase [Carnobacterium gallinarum]
MEKKELLYEGKAKKLFKTNEEEKLWVTYLNQATALNGVKKDTIAGKGQLNNQITSLIFSYLKQAGINSHFIQQISETDQLIEAVKMFPLEVVIRNVAAGSFSKRLGISEGTALDFPILEFYFKEDKLDDPMINEDHIAYLKIATKSEVQQIKELAHRINLALIQLFKDIGIRLVDFKLEFGKRQDGTIILADEISPDTCRLWDLATNEHLDKDIYRLDLGDLVPVYEEVLTRLKKLN